MTSDDKLWAFFVGMFFATLIAAIISTAIVQYHKPAPMTFGPHYITINQKDMACVSVQVGKEFGVSCDWASIKDQ
jgi:hypothetical protein